MNRLFLVTFCLCIAGCAKINQQQPRTHDPPTNVVVEKQVEKGDIDQVVKSLTFEREEYLSKLEKQRIKSTKDLIGNPKAQELVDELHQVETLLDIAKKEQWRQKFIQERRDREARQIARSQALQKVVELPLMPEDDVIRSLEKEEIAKSAIKNTEEWSQRFDSEMKQREELRAKAERDAEAYRLQLRRDCEKFKLQTEAAEAKRLADEERQARLQAEYQTKLLTKLQTEAAEAKRLADEERQARLQAERQAKLLAEEAKLRMGVAKLQAAEAQVNRSPSAWVNNSSIPQVQQRQEPVGTRAQWNEWWKSYTKFHANHSTDCTVYCCRHNDSFWSNCPTALQQMFPHEQVVSSNGAFKVVPKNKIIVYCSPNFWGLIPNTYHGAWCPYHPQAQQPTQQVAEQLNRVVIDIR